MNRNIAVEAAQNLIKLTPREILDTAGIDAPDELSGLGIIEAHCSTLATTMAAIHTKRPILALTPGCQKFTYCPKRKPRRSNTTPTRPKKFTSGHGFDNQICSVSNAQ
jgi:hypothetical protein